MRWPAKPSVLVARARGSKHGRDAIGLIELARGEERLAQADSGGDVRGRDAICLARELKGASRVFPLGSEVRSLEEERDIARRHVEGRHHGGERGIAVARDLEHHGADEIEVRVAWRRAQCAVDSREREVRHRRAHPHELGQVAMRVGVSRPQRDRFVEALLRFIETALRLQCAREHEARFGRGDSQRDGAARGLLGLAGMPQVAFGGGEVVPREAIVRVGGEGGAPARGVSGSICHGRILQ